MTEEPIKAPGSTGPTTPSSAESPDAVPPKAHWSRVSPWAKRVITVTVFLLAAFGAAVWIQSIAVRLDITLSGRNEFVTRCATAGDRVYKDGGAWVCVRGGPALVLLAPGGEDICRNAGMLALQRVDSDEWVYCVKGEIVDTLR